MSSSEILYWKDYFSNRPFSTDQLDYLMVLLSTNIADFRNANRGKGVKPFKVDDFLPKYLKSDTASRDKSLEQQKKEALAWAASYKAMSIRK